MYMVKLIAAATIRTPSTFPVPLASYRAITNSATPAPMAAESISAIRTLPNTDHIASETFFTRRKAVEFQSCSIRRQAPVVVD
jgi:hypothetical protein